MPVSRQLCAKTTISKFMSLDLFTITMYRHLMSNGCPFCRIRIEIKRMRVTTVSPINKFLYQFLLWRNKEGSDTLRPNHILSPLFCVWKIMLSKKFHSSSNLADGTILDTFGVDRLIRKSLTQIQHFSCRPASQPACTRLFEINMRSTIYYLLELILQPQCVYL